MPNCRLRLSRSPSSHLLRLRRTRLLPNRRLPRLRRSRSPPNRGLHRRRSRSPPSRLLRLRQSRSPSNRRLRLLSCPLPHWTCARSPLSTTPPSGIGPCRWLPSSLSGSTPSMSPAPSPSLSRRQQIVRDAFTARGLDAIVITSLPNIFYLTNFTGSSAIVVLTADRLLFMTDFRYLTVLDES